uniref:NADH-ubiquinone oxidoreductase chain 6 n=1 Tax=Ventidius hungerfordi TaxID=3095941 RepID=A0AB38Z6Q7_9HEMI|nr:NADH dehydrogenase subunit 6 [Ventidius hungerfordi]WPW47123.1 NADH dehydrogenase subunit 6 [Ventidius hungerfordi]
MKIMMILMMTLATMMTFLKHPLSMGLNLIMLTVIMSIYMNFMMKYAWYSYVLVLVMLGGMLVLFMYMASIASNEIMKFSFKNNLFMLLIMLISTVLLNNEINWFYSEILTNMENVQNMSMMKLFNGKTSIMTILMAIYLLLTMIFIIYITNSFEGPMRKKN